jgi:hypothetical protein
VTQLKGIIDRAESKHAVRAVRKKDTANGESASILGGHATNTAAAAAPPVLMFTELLSFVDTSGLAELKNAAPMFPGLPEFQVPEKYMSVALMKSICNTLQSCLHNIAFEPVALTRFGTISVLMNTNDKGKTACVLHAKHAGADFELVFSGPVSTTRTSPSFPLVEVVAGPLRIPLFVTSEGTSVTGMDCPNPAWLVEVLDEKADGTDGDGPTLQDHITILKVDLPELVEHADPPLPTKVDLHLRYLKFTSEKVGRDNVKLSRRATEVEKPVKIQRKQGERRQSTDIGDFFGAAARLESFKREQVAAEASGSADSSGTKRKVDTLKYGHFAFSSL